LIEHNVITGSREEEEKSLELKYVLLLKIFEIMEDMLKCEELNKIVLESGESQLFRRNIAIIISFISNEINKNEDSPSSLGKTYKEEILRLIMSVAQKLLSNPRMIVYYLQESEMRNNLIKMLSDLVKQNISKAMSIEEVKNNYGNILKFLETRVPSEPKNFPENWRNSFEKNLFRKKDLEHQINKEDQRKFEIWGEKSQWEKQETRKALEIAGLKDKELVKEIKLAAQQDTEIAGNTRLSSIFSENEKIKWLESLYKSYNKIKGKSISIEANRKLEYTLGRLNDESSKLCEHNKENVQNFAENIDSEILLHLFKADLTKIEKLKSDNNDDDDTNIVKLYVKEYINNLKSSQSENDNLTKEETKTETDGEVKAEIPSQEKQDGNNVEQAPVEEKLNEETKEEEKVDQDQNESAFKYFMDVTVKNEENFKFKVNKALKQGMRVKEMICVEKALTGSDKNNEEIIKQFTVKMTEFERNVVYASLGKSFEVELSEEFKKIVAEARAELLEIQKDFSQYEEAKGKISKHNEEKEEKKETNEEVKAEKAVNIIEEQVNEPQNENQKEDEDLEKDSNYDELDYDIQFLEIKDQAENNKEENDEEEEEEKKDINNDAEKTELIYEEGKGGESENKDEKIHQLISSFGVNDAFIMSACELLFCYWSAGASNLQKAKGFLKDSLGLNPANELKILDTILTVLYSPEFFESEPWKNQVKAYEDAVDTMLSFLTDYFNDPNRSYIFFVPKIYLEKFGNNILKDLKEKTNFTQKVSDCYTPFDMIIGLIETPSFVKNSKWTVQILEGVGSLLNKEKNLKSAEDVAQVPLENFKKTLSSKKFVNLLNLMEKSPTKIKSKVQEVFMNLKSVPGLFVSLQDPLSKDFYQLILANNKPLENLVNILKQVQDKEIGAVEIQEILANLENLQIQTLLTIILSFASVFQHNLFGSNDQQKSPKTLKKITTLLQTVTGSLFTQEDVKHFFVNCHELLELLLKIKTHFGSQESTLEKRTIPLILMCLSHYSIILMESSSEEGKPRSRSEFRKQTGGSSLSDIGEAPSLARLISFDEAEHHHHHDMVRLQRSYSHYRRETHVDFGAIFANFALKYSSQISKILTSRIEGLHDILNRILPEIIKKIPWIIDFKTKLKIFNDQVAEHLRKKGVAHAYSQREIKINRKNIVYSALKNFKNITEKDLVEHLEIAYKDESGVDGGGLSRDFYEVLSKQLFDPELGLFKLADNKISIQPNPLSGINPYDLILLQFAGIILAKAITSSNVMDLTFTKPFLKHLLGKKITIADMEEVDADLGKNLRWILQNNVEELYLTFTHEIEVLDERTVIELKEGGSDIFVDEENKKDYVKQICEYRMTKQIRKQLKAFLKGFRMVVPQELISHLSTSELEIMISGESQIDLAEMKKHAAFRNYSKDDQIVKWLWEVLEEFSQDQLTTFYYFVSGSTKVPFGGFKEHAVRIYHNSEKEGLPIAHTCSYAIEIPPYDSKDKLREKLLTAIFDGAGEFQIS